ncbi:glycoside hydrolase/phage tail family protein [Anaplasma capra]|uniref:glycoside hydrolase/phage tail family protein n=1 Tax=Anaplasma capra TaxID=1562740 RepID=UPI0021D597A2|nr:glycoside hydrolase TIM-barrel-like domain-containing protein [Anaplasma capra]MCU7611419.1 glycoside hydrolase TIM-barrel-like domain-containing protein [Anaplasma capra]MCU7612142.1 glycoside hydrolase TIM-barrel-like domain-containing protein [Anaplasma capra]
MSATLILPTIATLVSNTVWKAVNASVGDALRHITVDDTHNPHRRNRPGTGAARPLKEIKVQTSTYGKMLYEVYGTVRISGNIVWAQQIRHVRHKEIHTKNNSLSTKRSVTTGYYATFAVAICSGPIHRISRVWASGRPLDLCKIKHRLYKGTEDQEPDPLISSVEGNTPAYRGIAYIVIENLPLQDYNNTVPNFVFEVTAYPESFLRNHVTKKIDGIHTVGSGEFAYDTEVQTLTQTETIGTQEAAYGTAVKINGKTGYKESNALLALNTMQSTLPNLQWVAVTVCWFTDGANIKNCKLRPATAYEKDAKITPDIWKVGNFTAHRLMPHDSCYHAGTANDASLVRYIQKLKLTGYKVLLLLKLIADCEVGLQLVCENPGDISQFFDLQYHPFVQHYCLLTKGTIDAFVVGSNLASLTKIQDATGAFPAVNALARLAGVAKQTLGHGVIVTYAANWDEYHSHNGIYNMDTLWASHDVDVVGINAYFPLTDTPSPACGFSEQSIRQSWSSGEGYDYFFKPSPTGHASYKNLHHAWKNIHQWWSNHHTNHGSDIKTPWKPESKKVWFIEYGFRSVENCTHKPPSPEQSAKMQNNSIPERVDFAAQKAAIEGTLNAWKSSKMVERMLLYAWNLEPYLETESASYRHWQTSHWINGKIELVTLSAIIQSVLGKAGLHATTSMKTDKLVLGYSIHNCTPVWTIIKELQNAYCFDLLEKDGQLSLADSDPESILHIPGEDVYPESYRATYAIAAPSAASSLMYISHRFCYQPRLRSPQMCRANTSQTSGIVHTSLVLDDLQAEGIVDNSYYLAANQNCSYRMSVPIRYIQLNVGDVIRIELEHMQHTIKLTSIEIAGLQVCLEGISYVPTNFSCKTFPALPV